jgi:hypothetical protein
MEFKNHVATEKDCAHCLSEARLHLGVRAGGEQSVYIASDASPVGLTVVTLATVTTVLYM